MTQDAHPHFEAEALLAYLDGELPDAGQRAVEEHLADCAGCAARARSLHRLSESWQWTAAQHGDLRRRAVVAAGLAAAEAAHPAWRQRLRHWRERWAGLAEAGVRVAIEASGAAGRVAAEGVATLARSGSEWHFTPVQLPIGARGPAPAEPASALLATRVSASRPGARIAVRGGAPAEIDVRVDGLSGGDPAPLVLLIDAARPDTVPVQVAAVERRAGTDYHLARFDGVGPGDYLIVFEPLAARP